MKNRRIQTEWKQFSKAELEGKVETLGPEVRALDVQSWSSHPGKIGGEVICDRGGLGRIYHTIDLIAGPSHGADVQKLITDDDARPGSQAQSHVQIHLRDDPKLAVRRGTNIRWLGKISARC